MPELPDIVTYIEALDARVAGRRLENLRVAHPFLLRTVEPPAGDAIGRRVQDIRRVGKRIAVKLDGALWLVLHLMIAGRLHWRAAGAALKGRNALAAFDFENGSAVLTEAGSRKRTSLHIVEGDNSLRAMDPGGLEVLGTDAANFAQRVRRVNHTLKRALTDPRILSGIGNAYSDEILHRARLSPVALTQSISDDESRRLFEAARDTLAEWVERLRGQTGDAFPEHVTAFRDGMAVHGRYGEPCPVCASPIQRIRYRSNETNYCVRCQTGGRVLADRSLSRLLKRDWPRTLEELEELRGFGGGS